MPLYSFYETCMGILQNIQIRSMTIEVFMVKTIVYALQILAEALPLLGLIS